MYEVDCREITSYSDFIEAFNLGMIYSLGGKWNGNLDALNDYLAWPQTNHYILRVRGEFQCEKVLSYKRKPFDSQILWALIKKTFEDNKEWVTVQFD